MRIGKQVAEAAGSDEEALRLLTAVGIPEPKRRMRAFRTNCPAVCASAS